MPLPETPVLCDTSSDGITFENVLKKYNKLHFTVAKIIEFTHVGLLNAKTKLMDGTLRDNYYIEEEIQKCITNIKRDRQLKRGYTKKDLMKILNIGEKRINSIKLPICTNNLLCFRPGGKGGDFVIFSLLFPL
ncbi:hypothetical protein FE782_00815 [Paenibacillus antri]|uniref:Uncharacterized protein n=1 Tax=Paenibacillus antri TaxID=2582848 RepID=A0A5R9GBT6_9BACL|nr:hypothetical protein [Paenibacillus antri]TLS53927.1 hypothetical protein FE782_00815 [Paenibacillus antri]